MVKAIALAVVAVCPLVLWLLKRYFTKGDTVRRLKKERRGVRREMAKISYYGNDGDSEFKWHKLNDRLRELNADIADRSIRK